MENTVIRPNATRNVDEFLSLAISEEKAEWEMSAQNILYHSVSGEARITFTW